MFYVKQNECGFIVVVETTLTEKRGTWHYWTDDGGDHAWRSRGLGTVRETRVDAIVAYLSRHPEDAETCVLVVWDMAYDFGWDSGYGVGKVTGGMECRKACPMQVKIKRRSFMARLLAGRPFAAV